MRNILAAVLVVCAAPAVLGAPAAARQETRELPIKRVILYKHGVGYFERIGSVEGNARIVLRFRKKQMSDLLKSLTVLDLGGGVIRTIAYDSTKTVDQQLAEYTFDLRKADSLAAILEQMKGSEIAVTVVGKKLAGRLLVVEKRYERSGRDTQIEKYYLSILTPGANIKKYDLADISDLKFTDPALQKELEKYLAILFSRHRRDEKQVVILADGKGRRDIFAGYIEEQPVWKVSYRLVLATEEKPLLQGWAIVDNVSSEDWENVDLSLVSGLPVSFVQNLYDPFYVKRPEIRLQREVAVGPVVHAAGRRGAAAAKGLKRAERGRRKERLLTEAEDKAAAPAGAPRPDMLATMARQAVSTVAQEAGALFVYHIKDPVSVKRDRSALLPIINKRVVAEHVALYNERTRRDNPMDAVRLKNTTALTLEGGPVTVIEDNTYVGEALIDTVKPDEERYVSFAVDLGTRVNTKYGASRQSVYLVRIVHGAMYTHYKQRRTKTYNLANLEEKPKTVIIEHPFSPDWKLVDTPAPREKTKDHYRFEVKLPPKADVAFAVTEERPRQTTYSISNITKDQIRFFLRQRYIDEKTQAFLEKVVALQAQINSLKRQAGALKQERSTIFSDQTRLRNNLKALGTSEGERNYRGRIVKQHRIEAINGSLKEIERSIQSKQNELNKLLREFTFQAELG